MKPQPHLHRVVQLGEPRPMTIDIHDHGCACERCEPYRPSLPPRLTAAAIARIGVLGFIGGAGGSLLLDPAGAAQSLLATIGVGL